MIFNTNKPPMQLTLTLLDPAGGRVAGDTLRADATICFQIEARGFPADPTPTITCLELENLGNERRMPVQLPVTDLQRLAVNGSVSFRLRVFELMGLVTNPGSTLNMRAIATLAGKADPVPSNAAALQDPAPTLVRLVQTAPPNAPEQRVWTTIRELTGRLLPAGFTLQTNLLNSDAPFRELRNEVGRALNRLRMPEGFRVPAAGANNAQRIRNIVDLQVAALDDRGQDAARLPPPQPTANKAGADLALDRPLFCELIFVFWIEIGLLAQSFRLVAHRFQNYGASKKVARLSHLNVAALRPVAGLLFDWLSQQHEVRTVHARVHAYLHEFNCALPGKAARPIAPVRTETGFSSAFHGLLHVALRYYLQTSELTWVPDAFPLLTALRTLSEVLKRTEVNTFQRTAFDARREFASYGVILGTPEVRRFLVTEGIPAREDWIPAVDALNDLAGWRVGAMLNYLDLATEGERILASVRWLDWDAADDAMAQAWANANRQSVQCYAFRTRLISGLDLASDQAEHLRDHALPMSTLAYRRLGIAA